MSHHDHHQHHHQMNSSPTSSMPDIVQSTESTVLQAVISTLMPDVTSFNSTQNTSFMSMDQPPGFHNAHGSISHDNHGSVHSSSDVSVNSDHGMLMYFHGGVDATVLFQQWSISTTGGMVASVLGIFFLALMYEGLKFFRESLFKKYFTSLEYSSVSVLGDDGKSVTEIHKVARSRMFSWQHALQTFLHVIQMVISYFLMLIFMTYNVWLCLGVVFGAGTGYFLFGWKKATVVDITEHCH